MKVLVIDNYDSFTYNLVDYIASAGAEVRVERNDAITAAEAEAWAPTHLVVSPGPGPPRRGRRLGGRHPAARRPHPGARRVPRPPGDRASCTAAGSTGRRGSMHGKADRCATTAPRSTRGLPNPFEAGRYHSLAAPEVPGRRWRSRPARADGEVMGVRHRRARRCTASSSTPSRC